MEQFEDDPLEFIRQDTSTGMGGSNSLTQCQAASDLIQALISSGYEATTTEIVETWITSSMQEYAVDPVKNWRAKDSGIYLIMVDMQVRPFSQCHFLNATRSD